MMLKKLILCAAFLCVFPTVGAAQDNGAPDIERPRYGFTAGLNANVHTADFRAIPGVPNCCPSFESGFGLAPAFGLLYELPLGPAWMLGFRGVYSSSSASLSRTETRVAEVNGEAAPVAIEHEITASLGAIGLEPLLSMRLGEHFQLVGGARLGIQMQKNYAQEERLADDVVTGTFDNNRRVRNESSGELPGASTFQAAVLLGTAYEVSLNAEGTLLAAPEAYLQIGLTPVVEDLNWYAHGLRAGISLKYSPLPPPEAAPPPPPPPPAPPVRPVTLVAQVEAFGVDGENREEESVMLQVEEFVAVQTRPVLSYIFFDENSAELPQRYHTLSPQDAASFNMDRLHNRTTLDVYRDVLNIVGYRLQQEPGTRLRLVGTDGSELEENEYPELSQRRAERVKRYLRDVWGIAESRMMVEARGLPSRPSNPERPEGMAENRRVELYVEQGDILSPVVTGDTLRTATPPTVRFRTTVQSAAGVTSWQLQAEQEGRRLKGFGGEGPVPERIDWQMKPDEMPEAPGVILYSLAIKDRTGGRYTTSPRTLPVEQITIRKKRRERVADIELERYSLILFEFDRASLLDEQLAIVKRIRERLRPDSRVTVRGYTDRTGDTEHNRRLALERARAVARALGVEGVEVHGETEPLYDNSVPEGRFYSRTVVVEVETPVREGDSG